MTDFHIKPSKVSGRITVPSSKSHTLRALLFALMAKGKSIIRNPLPSPDAQSMIEAITHLGAKVSLFDDRIEVVGTGGNLKKPNAPIDAGNSGQVLRFIGALAALSSHEVVLTGDHSIQTSRPVLPLIEGLTLLGAKAESVKGNGMSPIRIQGPISGGEATLDGADSQPVSGLLMAAAFAKGPSTIRVRDPGEKPWIDVTLGWLKRLGMEISHTDHSEYVVPGGLTYEGFDYTVPGDFSSAAFPIVAALITGSKLQIDHLDLGDAQGDKAIIDLLEEMGAKMTIDGNSLHIHPSTLHGIEIDVNPIIDAITILAVVGCYAEGETLIKNGSIARNKESDRIHAICHELKKMGADIEEKPDGMLVRKGKLKGAKVATYSDHRMVMSLSVAALGADGETQVVDTECVAKSFPGFLETMKQMKVAIK